MMKLFVGFDLGTDSTLARKITGFRKRFDPKFSRYAFPHMAMLAPFQSLDFQIDDIVETLREELDSFFFGQNETPKLGFKGLDVHQHKRKYILHLNPLIDANLEYCMDLVQEVCMSNLAPNIKYKPNKKQFLPLGYFHSEQELELVMEQAQMEFSEYGEIPVESISLYALKGKTWVREVRLLNFELKDSRFLHLNNHSL
ncbi:MAG: hypothetical protein CME62_17420 [Halobacteriovoraceae bacterium]|nr:hypothetical protein [Halobacteriovoraceae bacterium]|tara:strand:+ start:9626 stop:10222 length:597 start_codon:yes stop_codon:yes gene_type:complete